jgi:hypothetical protein
VCVSDEFLGLLAVVGSVRANAFEFGKARARPTLGGVGKVH